MNKPVMGCGTPLADTSRLPLTRRECRESAAVAKSPSTDETVAIGFFPSLLTYYRVLGTVRGSY